MKNKQKFLNLKRSKFARQNFSNYFLDSFPRNNKKAWIGLLTVLMLGVIIGIVIYSYSSPLPWQEIMGKRQAAILETYSIGEQARVYIEDSANLAAQQAIYKFGLKGGYYDAPVECMVNGYAIQSGNCKLSDEELLENFKEEFLWSFEQYLDAFELPSYGGDDIYTLYDVISLSGFYDLKITIDSVTIKGYPDIYESEAVYEDEEGETIEVIETVESSIEISSEEYGFDYFLDPYFEITVDVDLYELLNKANSGGVSCGEYTCYDYNTDTELLIGNGLAVEKKNLVIRVAR